MSGPRSHPTLRCGLCPSTKDIQSNHVGGRNHIAWFQTPLCVKHHDEFHRRLEISGVDLRSTPDLQERIRQARKATLIFLWMLEECGKCLECKEKQS
jgi:hypothetical protein